MTIESVSLLVEPRFLEYDVYGDDKCWYYMDDKGEDLVLAAMVSRCDFAGLKYGHCWCMDRQLLRKDGNTSNFANYDQTASIPIPSKIRFLNLNKRLLDISDNVDTTKDHEL